LARVLAGEKAALADLRELEDLELEYLQGAVLNCSQVSWLAERSAELALFFEALQGQEASLKRLKRKKASLARLAVQVGEILKRLASDPDKQGGEDKDDKGQVLYTEGATADVGLLVGEEHLRQHEYARAVEAFTRSLRTNPSADAYEGRARAYHALALADEARARALRDYDERGPSAP
jgi:tetratricopeptide (TPR) repeat protein